MAGLCSPHPGSHAGEAAFSRSSAACSPASQRRATLISFRPPTPKACSLGTGSPQGDSELRARRGPGWNRVVHLRRGDARTSRGGTPPPRPRPGPAPAPGPTVRPVARPGPPGHPGESLRVWASGCPTTPTARTPRHRPWQEGGVGGQRELWKRFAPLLTRVGSSLPSAPCLRRGNRGPGTLGGRKRRRQGEGRRSPAPQSPPRCRLWPPLPGGPRGQRRLCAGAPPGRPGRGSALLRSNRVLSPRATPVRDTRQSDIASRESPPPAVVAPARARGAGLTHPTVRGAAARGSPALDGAPQARALGRFVTAGRGEAGREACAQVRSQADRAAGPPAACR